MATNKHIGHKVGLTVLSEPPPKPLATQLPADHNNVFSAPTLGRSMFDVGCSMFPSHTE